MREDPHSLITGTPPTASSDPTHRVIANPSMAPTPPPIASTSAMPPPASDVPTGEDDVFLDPVGLNAGLIQAPRTRVGLLDTLESVPETDQPVTFSTPASDAGVKHYHLPHSAEGMSSLEKRIPKGKGKGKTSRPRQSEIALEKSNFGSMETRSRVKVRQEAQKRMRTSTDKLISTGRKLTNRNIDDDLTDDDDVEGPPVLNDDFSSHDLIRNNIADPHLFDEPPSQPENENEIVIVSHENAIPTTQIDNLRSRWSYSLNPFSYLQRSEPQPQNTDQPENNTTPVSTTQRKQSAISDGPPSEPRCTSTPVE